MNFHAKIASYLITNRGYLLSLFITDQLITNKITAPLFKTITRRSLIVVGAAIIVGEVRSTKTNNRRGLNIRRGDFYADTQLYNCTSETVQKCQN